MLQRPAPLAHHCFWASGAAVCFDGAGGVSRYVVVKMG